MKIFSFIQKDSTSFFNYILIVFVCLSLYQRFYQENLQFNKISFVILRFIMHILDKNIQFYNKMSLLLFFKRILIIFEWLSLYLSFLQKNLQFYTLPYVILNFIIHMLDGNLQFFMKCLHLLFQLHSNCIYMPIIVSVFSIFKFINSYVILIFITQTLYENHQFYMKMSPHMFELYANCIFMTITVSEFFPPKSSILSITLLILYFIIHMVVENLQYFSENISTSFFNCILIVFLCLSLYLCFFKYSIL